MSKLFLNRLHQLLDEMGVSSHPKERVDAFAAIFGTTRQKASLILNGANMPTEALLCQMAQEFEVTAQWLVGGAGPEGKLAAGKSGATESAGGT